MTTVSGGTLNPTHSLTIIRATQLNWHLSSVQISSVGLYTRALTNNIICRAIIAKRNRIAKLEKKNMQENRNAENMTLLMIEKAAKQCILIARRAYSLGP